ncbi:MAG: HAD-IC family P-type ATPase [Chthoniobacter sp.]
MGSVTVICSDKTGTLTENRMGVTSLETAGHAIENPGEDLASPFSSVALLLAAGALCNDARLEKRGAGPQTPLGDPMEIALATAARRARMDKGELDAAFSRVAEIPFDSARKRMTTVHRVPANLPAGLRDRTLPLASGGLIAFTKGALESILEVCDRQRVEAGEGPLDSAARTAIRLAGERWGQTGRRVLGFAYRQVLSGENLVSDEHRLVFLGLMGLSDPTRAEAKSAVQSCRTAGIRPVMITGDHPFTAQHVARELGIEGPVLCGAELEAMPDERLEALVDQIGIYARVLPEHKLRIVRALQARGHVVSMTGDGVNDAPALRQADIGVAMGITGTDVTKQVSDMVLLDDNFATVVAAVEEGRAIYDNIRKFIRYVLAGNFGELLVMLLGPFFGLSLPLLPVQILWINLVSDGLNGLALSVEPPERDTMNRPPRRAGESIFAGGMVRHIVGVGALLGLISLAVGLFFWHRHHPAWQAAIFLTLASGQAFQTLAARSWRDSIFRLGFKSNPMTLVSVALAVASTLAIVYVPALQNLFGTVSLSIGQLLAILAVSTVPFWSIEYGKYLLRRRG